MLFCPKCKTTKRNASKHCKDCNELCKWKCGQCKKQLSAKYYPNQHLNHCLKKKNLVSEPKIESIETSQQTSSAPARVLSQSEKNAKATQVHKYGWSLVESMDAEQLGMIFKRVYTEAAEQRKAELISQINDDDIKLEIDREEQAKTLCHLLRHITKEQRLHWLQHDFRKSRMNIGQDKTPDEKAKELIEFLQRRQETARVHGELNEGVNSPESSQVVRDSNPEAESVKTTTETSNDDVQKRITVARSSEVEAIIQQYSHSAQESSRPNGYVWTKEAISNWVSNHMPLRSEGIRERKKFSREKLCSREQRTKYSTCDLFVDQFGDFGLVCG